MCESTVSREYTAVFVGASGSVEVTGAIDEIANGMCGEHLIRRDRSISSNLTFEFK